MNLKDIFNEELPGSEDYIIEEGIFKVSPMIAFLAFKNKAVSKAKDFAQDLKGSAQDVAGEAISKVEKLKAKTIGKSGYKDNDTVYKFTKEQKKVLAHIYNKYGPDIVKKIQDFRTNVMVPYQIIKRNVEKNHSLTNKEVFGMTKEEYYKYRESGRRKIEKRGTYFKDTDELKNKAIASRLDLEKARKDLKDFKEGKMVDISASHYDKILNQTGLGNEKLNNWSESELEKTSTKIENLMKLLKDSKRDLGYNQVLVKGRANSSNKETRYRSDIEREIKSLREFGYNKTYKIEDKGEHKRRGSFKDALNTYMLRRNVIQSIQKDSQNSDFRKLYIKILEDALKNAEEKQKERLENYVGIRKTIELNEFEKKIWKKKLNGTYYSGNIDDWYLKIKPEDFFDTKYYKKGEKVLKAEKEIDAATKRFERELKSIMSDEDVALCKKYRLFNNFLTVKQLKNPNNLFKSSSDLKDDLKKSSEQKETKPKKEISIGDLRSELDSLSHKEFNSIRDLEDKQKEIFDISKNMTLDKSTKEDLTKFLDRKNPRAGSKITKVSRQNFNDKINRILDKEYSGKTDAQNDLKDIEDYSDDFKKMNGDLEFRQFEHDYNKARNKLISFIDQKENE